MNNSNFTIVTFYQFKKNKYLEKQKKNLKDFCYFHKLRGTIIIAKEGINGSIAGSEISIKKLKIELIKIGYNSLELKYSLFKFMPFNRLKIKLKKEIITFDNSRLDVENIKAQYVEPSKWNKLLEKEETLVIDVRNNFENKIGTFKNSINPNTKNFSEFKNYINTYLSFNKDKNIAMFCTGGIRCEKASSYMLKKGFKKLYQLKGGILKYLEVIPKDKSIWKGECFVFDNRVSVKNELAKGTFELCHACRNPVSVKDRKSRFYKKGISCKNCYKDISDDKKMKLKERNKQIEISKKRGLYNPYIKYTPKDFY